MSLTLIREMILIREIFVTLCLYLFFLVKFRFPTCKSKSDERHKVWESEPELVRPRMVAVLEKIP